MTNCGKKIQFEGPGTIPSINILSKLLPISPLIPLNIHAKHQTTFIQIIQNMNKINFSFLGVHWDSNVESMGTTVEG